ncbi:hypothetical protein DAEQUDRAFT_721268 [Daedalea quercina L-15889]|uniref:Uncharacterized protein n=1 Tax=Daedalea quercina L-15889 TaxID=1314783 RepID=A0A165TQQ5_9APHY|nr:hypothetical protein DAEQUDRAFT_721268 [Daedalea quercina L-15889]
MSFQIEYNPPATWLVRRPLGQVLGATEHSRLWKQDISLDEITRQMFREVPEGERCDAPQQEAFIQHVLTKLRGVGNADALWLPQSWNGLTAADTVYHRMLDEEPYDTRPAQKISLPSPTRLSLEDVHPKLVYAFLRRVDLPNVTSLDLTYDIAGQPDRRELLLVLMRAGAPLLARLDDFATTEEMHCHRWDVLERLYEAIPNVTSFKLHSWADCYNCEEWFLVLQAQWERVAARPRAGVQPYLPRLREMSTSGLVVWKLRRLLDIRRRTGFPVKRIVYSEGYILRSEYDLLEAELEYFKCYEEITPDPEEEDEEEDLGNVRGRGLDNRSRTFNTSN